MVRTAQPTTPETTIKTYVKEALKLLDYEMGTFCHPIRRGVWNITVIEPAGENWDVVVCLYPKTRFDAYHATVWHRELGFWHVNLGGATGRKIGKAYYQPQKTELLRQS